MPAPVFADLDAKFEPAITWRFLVTLPQITTSQTSSNRSGIDVTSGLLVQQVQAPFRAIDTEAVPFQAGSRHIPVGWSMDNLTLHFLETAGYDVLEYLINWKYSAIKENGNFGLPKDTWKTITLVPYNQQGENAASFVYQDCYPFRVDPYNYDGATHANIVASATFVVNKPMKPTFGGNTANINNASINQFIG